MSSKASRAPLFRSVSAFFIPLLTITVTALPVFWLNNNPLVHTVAVISAYAAGFLLTKLFIRNRRGMLSRERAETLRSYEKELMAIFSPEKCKEALLHIIEELYPESRPVLYSWSDRYGGFAPMNNILSDHSPVFAVYDDFILWLGEQDAVLTLGSFRSDKNLSERKETAEKFFSSTASELLVPLTMNESLLAFIVMKGRRIPLVSEEMNFLEELRKTASVVLSNATLYARLDEMNRYLEEKVRERGRELEEAQGQLVQSEKMASLGVMVAGIAHEVNTPAGVINGSINNLQKDLLHLAENALPVPVTEMILYFFRHGGYGTDNAAEKFRKRKEYTQQLQQAGFTDEREIRKRAEFRIEYDLGEKSAEIDTISYDHFQTLETSLRINRSLTNMKMATGSIVRIVRALKYYSHIDQSKTEEISLAESLENTLVILHNRIKHKIELQRDFRRLPPLKCVVGEINQIWTNLIINSIQAMKDGGRLKLTLDSEKLPEHEAGAAYAPDEIKPAEQGLESRTYQVVTIEDNGPGIPHEIREKIFDPFFTTKPPGEGSGLGLGIVVNILRNHHGFLSLESRPGRTVFKVYLPASE